MDKIVLKENNNEIVLNEELKDLFESANKSFINNNIELIERDVSERTLCGALMIELHEALKKTRFFNYYVDVEYNRNIYNRDRFKKIISENNQGNRKIICDLIVHQRGKEDPMIDNLIAIEMKKSNRRPKDKKKDRERLKSLTQPYNSMEINDRIDAFNVVRGYALGVYYELDISRKKLLIEYYVKGKMDYSYDIVL